MRFPKRGLRLAVPLGLLLLAAGCFFRGDPPERPDVLLVTIDTLRADRLGPYGAEDVSTPVVDELAREGVVFEQVSAPMPLTLPSHFSIFTGRYPREHGVLNHGMVLPEEEKTLAEILRDHGYRTGGFVAVNLLSPESGADQGFEEFHLPQKSLQRPASRVVPQALRWLESVGEEERVFLWVHLFDPHLPYAPPEPYGETIQDELREHLPSLHWPDFVRIADRNEGDIPAGILDHAKALYDGEVEFSDHWLGRLFEGFQQRRDWQKTLVVLTADHGECFSNGVYFEHADCLFDGAIRVPLILRYPDGRDGGQRRTDVASLVDVAPTVLSAVGIPRPDGLSGRSLEAPPEAEEAEDRAVLIQHPLYRERPAARRTERQQRIRSVAGEPTREIVTEAERVGLVTRDWKYIRSAHGEELFARSPTLDEGQNLATSEPETLRRLRNRLRRSLEDHPLHLIAPEDLTDELRQSLEALGYL